MGRLGIWQMVRVSEHSNVRRQSLESMLSVGGAQGQSLCNLFVDNDIDLDTTICCTEKGLVNTPLFVSGRRSAQIKFRRQPPIQDPNCLASTFQSMTDSPHVGASVDKPLDIVALFGTVEGTIEAVSC